MPVFISHSVSPWELALVNAVADVASQRGLVPIIPDRDWDPAADPPSPIAAQIQSSLCVIAIATQGGQHLNWLNQEVNYSQGLSPPRPSLIVADNGILVNPDYQCIRINRRDPLTTLSQVRGQIDLLVQDAQTQQLVRGLVIGGLALLFLSALRGE